MQQCDEERNESLFDLYFGDCQNDMDIYTTALKGMCKAYREVKNVADKVCDGEVPPKQSVNVLHKFTFMYDTFMGVRKTITNESYENILDIPEGIINQFSREAEGRSRAVRVVNSFAGQEGFKQYEKCVSLLILANIL